MSTTGHEPAALFPNSLETLPEPSPELGDGATPERCAEVPPLSAQPASGGENDPRPFLRAGSPSALLERWVAGDPLGVRPRVFRYLTREALFVDADRVHLRALALGAFEVARAPARGSLGPWLDDLVERATRALLKEDALGGTAAEEVRSGACCDLARQLELDPERVHDACLALDLRPLEERSALQALLVERLSLDAAARRAGTSATEFARRARRALLAGLSVLDGADLGEVGA